MTELCPFFETLITKPKFSKIQRVQEILNTFSADLVFVFNEFIVVPRLDLFSVLAQLSEKFKFRRSILKKDQNSGISCLICFLF